MTGMANYKRVAENLFLRLLVAALAASPLDAMARDYGLSEASGTALWLPAAAAYYGSTKSKELAWMLGIGGLVLAFLFPVEVTLLVGLVLLIAMPWWIAVPAGAVISFAVYRYYARRLGW